MSSRIVGFLLFLISLTAIAHGPSRLKVNESVAIDAPAEKVWAAIKDFDALAKWHPALAESPADKANEVGSVRQLTLKDGGKLVEILEKHDDAKMIYTYRAENGGALPVANYSSTIQVKADGASKSTVNWRGGFYRMNPALDAPKGQDDDSAVAAVTGVYKSGLANLKKIIEQK